MGDYNRSFFVQFVTFILYLRQNQSGLIIQTCHVGGQSLRLYDDVIMHVIFA